MKFKNYFSKTFQFSYSDFDQYDNIFPKALFNMFQNVAGAHAEELNMGYEDFISNNLIWVLVRSKIEVLGELVPDVDYKIITFPVKSRGLNFQRDYLILDVLTNEILVKATSIWVILDYKSRRFVRLEDIKNNVLNDPKFKFCSKFEQQELLKGILQDKTLLGKEPVKEIEVIYPYIDHNSHMNNVYYSDLILSVLNLKHDEFVESMQINFEKECSEKEKISLYIKDEENFNYVFGYKKVDNNEVLVFSSRTTVSKINQKYLDSIKKINDLNKKQQVRVERITKFLENKHRRKFNY